MRAPMAAPLFSNELARVGGLGGLPSPRNDWIYASSETNAYETSARNEPPEPPTGGCPRSPHRSTTGLRTVATAAVATDNEIGPSDGASGSSVVGG